MSTISVLRQQKMIEIKNKKIEYKETINDYLKKHNLDGDVVRVSDNQIGRLKLYEAHGYFLGRLAFYPIKPNGKVDIRNHILINEKKLLNQYKPYEKLS